MMKSIGRIIKVRRFGMIKIPSKVMRDYELIGGVRYETYRQGDSIIIEKYHECCVICGKTDKLFEYRGKRICDECFNGIEVIFKKYKKQNC